MFLMTPGPTEVPDRVREAMARRMTSPDFDSEFKQFYNYLVEKIGKIYFKNSEKADKDILILGGEGILGLEASISSTVGPEDKVLCISNGIYGDGFANFVENVSAEPELYSYPYDGKIDLQEVKSAAENEDFKVATLVHCETPTGTLNNLDEILPVLRDNGIITIVDAVSSLGGTEVPTEDIDICIGGSQKCFSSPPGLSILSVSSEAWDLIRDRGPKSYYTNLAPWKEMWIDAAGSNKDREGNGQEFPYTHLTSNLYALDESMNIILEEGIENVFSRHRRSAKLCREMAREMGLTLYPKPESLMSPTVTAIEVDGNSRKLQKKIRRNYGILLATGLGELSNDIIRVGHMGHNAREHKVRYTMEALEDAATELGII